MTEFSGFFYCTKCGKNTSFCHMPKGWKIDHYSRGNNLEWKYKDGKWSLKNLYNGWCDFRKFSNDFFENNIFFCDNCYEEKPSFTDFIKGYPAIILDNLVDKINELEKEILKIKLNEKENEIKNLKNENNYIIQIKKYENEIQILKNDNSNLINKIIKLLENNLNNNTNNKNVPSNDIKIIPSTEESKTEDNKRNDLKEINLRYAFDLKKGEFLMPVIFQSADSKIQYAIICKNTDRFNMIENILYEKYPEYIEYENYFICNGIKINKYKTMEQNNIKYSDIIVLHTQK